MHVNDGGLRRHLDKGEASPLCGRCGGAAETEMHRSWECSGNDGLEDEEVTATAHLCKKTVEGMRQIAFWTRGLVPANWTEAEP